MIVRGWGQRVWRHVTQSAPAAPRVSRPRRWPRPGCGGQVGGWAGGRRAGERRAQARLMRAGAGQAAAGAARRARQAGGVGRRRQAGPLARRRRAPCGMKSAATRASTISSTSPASRPPWRSAARIVRSASRCMSWRWGGWVGGWADGWVDGWQHRRRGASRLGLRAGCKQWLQAVALACGKLFLKGPLHRLPAPALHRPLAPALQQPPPRSADASGASAAQHQPCGQPKPAASTTRGSLPHRPAHAGAHGLDHCPVGAQHRIVDQGLVGREAPADGEGGGDVGGVAAVGGVRARGGG